MKFKFRATSLVWLLALAIAFGGGAWAGRTALVPTVAVTEKEPLQGVTAEVVEQSIGSTTNFSVTAKAKTVPIFHNQLAGTVTFVADKTEFDLGDTLYAVNMVPVRVVEGALPFYRDMGQGAKGTDVQQLQGTLKKLGYLVGVADGTWGPGTTRAVKAWQKDLGTAQSGQVSLGELVAVAEFPATLLISEDVSFRLPLSADVLTVSLGLGDVEFQLVLTEAQAILIPQDAEVEIFYEDRVWRAVIGETTVDVNGNFQIDLVHPDGGKPCGDECKSLPVMESMGLRSVQHLVPQTTGPAIPAAAIRTDNVGGAYVLRSDGTKLPVTVVGTSGGVSIIDGVDLGTLVTVIESGSPSTDQSSTNDPGLDDQGTEPNEPEVDGDQ